MIVILSPKYIKKLNKEFNINIMSISAEDEDISIELTRKGSFAEISCTIKINIPYMHEVFDEVYSNLDKIKKAGVYGVIIEGMKYKKKKSGLIKVAGDYTYPYDVILSDFIKLKDKAHKLGLKIYAGENRIRVFGDSLSCCGIDGLEGFIPNKFNLNHLVNGDKPKPTEKMKEKGTSCCFKGIDQTPSGSIKYKNQSFGYSMLEFYKNKTKLVEEIFGRNTKKH